MDGKGENSTYRYFLFLFVQPLTSATPTLMPTTATAMATMVMIARTRWIFFFLSLRTLSSLHFSFNASTFSNTLENLNRMFFSHLLNSCLHGTQGSSSSQQLPISRLTLPLGQPLLRPLPLLFHHVDHCLTAMLGNREHHLKKAYNANSSPIANLHGNLCLWPVGGKEGPKQRLLLNKMLRQLLYKLVNFLILADVGINGSLSHIFSQQCCPNRWLPDFTI